MASSCGMHQVDKMACKSSIPSINDSLAFLHQIVLLLLYMHRYVQLLYVHGMLCSVHSLTRHLRMDARMLLSLFSTVPCSEQPSTQSQLRAGARRWC